MKKKLKLKVVSAATILFFCFLFSNEVGAQTIYENPSTKFLDKDKKIKYADTTMAVLNTQTHQLVKLPVVTNLDFLILKRQVI